jgi:ubiquinone/menaquinone biosynthesis C-methylase UbiE
MRQKFADELLNTVEEGYDEISAEFSHSRSNPWYEFEIYKELTKPGDQVLDLGCGNGRLFEYLEEFDIDYTGIDVSQGLLDKAKFKYRNKKSLSRFRFKKGSFLEIPYKRPYFDKIFCVASFHHIPSKQYRLKALAEMKRVLNKDGVIAISVWNLWRKQYRKYIFESLLRLNKYDFADCLFPWSKTGVMRYYHAFNVFEMRHLVREAGFYIVDEVMVTKGSVTEKFLEAENLIFIIKPLNENS